MRPQIPRIDFEYSFALTSKELKMCVRDEMVLVGTAG